METARQAMAVPPYIQSYGLLNAYSGRMQVFSASELIPKKGGMKDFLSSPEKHKKQALTSSEKKQQYFGKLFAELEDRFEELKQQLFSRLRETLVDEIELPHEGPIIGDGNKIQCWNCNEPWHKARDCNKPRRKRRGKNKGRRLRERERDGKISQQTGRDLMVSHLANSHGGPGTDSNTSSCGASSPYDGGLPQQVRPGGGMQVEGEAPTLHSVSGEPTLGTGRRQPVTSPHGGGAELEGHDAQAEGLAPALHNISGEPIPGTERHQPTTSLHGGGAELDSQGSCEQGKQFLPLADSEVDSNLPTNPTQDPRRALEMARQLGHVTASRLLAEKLAIATKGRAESAPQHDQPARAAAEVERDALGGGGSSDAGDEDDDLRWCWTQLMMRPQGEETTQVPGCPNDQPEGEDVPQRVEEQQGAARHSLVGGDTETQPVGQQVPTRQPTVGDDRGHPPATEDRGRHPVEEEPGHQPGGADSTMRADKQRTRRRKRSSRRPRGRKHMQQPGVEKLQCANDSEWYRQDELLETRLELAQALAKLNQHNIHDEAVAFGPFCRLRVIDTIATQQAY
jgi:hypothetical protein